MKYQNLRGLHNDLQIWNAPPPEFDSWNLGIYCTVKRR